MRMDARAFNYARGAGEQLNSIGSVVKQIGSVVKQTEKVKQITTTQSHDLGNIITQNSTTRLRLDTVEANTPDSLVPNNNMISLDSINALSSTFEYTQKKLIFALNCIKKNEAEIISKQSYSRVLRPIFIKKFTDNATDVDGYVCIDAIGPQNNILFFEADSTQDNTTELIGMYSNFEPAHKVFIIALKEKIYGLIRATPLQNIFYFTMLYDWIHGPKIGFFIVIRDIRNRSRYISIASGVNLSTKIKKYNYISDIPDVLRVYLSKLDAAYSTLCNNSDYNPSNGTTYQVGDKFNILKVVSSPEYPYWNGRRIMDCYIRRNSNIDMPTVMRSINTKIIKTYLMLEVEQMLLINYNIGDDAYIGIIKLFVIPPHGLCYQLIGINKTEIFVPSIINNGDIIIKGNFAVVNSNNEPIIETDNTHIITCFHNKVGINQKPYEVDALLDIDNLTQQFIVELFTTLVPYAVNSQDIIDVINDLENPSTYNINTLFKSNGKLFSYTSQCFIIKIAIKPITLLIDIEFVFNDVAGRKMMETNYSLNRISKLVKVVNNTMTDYFEAGDSNYIFSVYELLSDNDENWYICCIRSIIRDNTLIFVITQYDVTNTMKDKSYAPILKNIMNNITNISHTINTNILLFKKQSFYNDNGEFNCLLYLAYIKETDYLVGNYDLLAEEYVYCRRASDWGYIYTGADPSWTGVRTTDIWVNGFNAGSASASIEEQTSILYNNRNNCTYAVNYTWNKSKKFTLVHKCNIRGEHCIIGCGVNLLSILNQSLRVKGDNVINGNLIINDQNNNIIFKVDNVSKTITNAYNVGIGLENPKSMLDIKDTSIQDVINEINERSGQCNNMNILTAQLRLANNEDEMRSIMSTIPTDFSNHVVLFKLNMDTQDANDITVICNPQNPHWHGYTLGNLSSTDIYNYNLIQTIRATEQQNIDNELIFDDVIYNNIMMHPVYGSKIMAWKIMCINTQVYVYMFSLTLSSRHINYETNTFIQQLYHARKCAVRMLYSLWRRKQNKPVLLNLREGTNTLNTLIQLTKYIHKRFFTLKFIKTSPQLSTTTITPIDFETGDMTSSYDLTNAPHNIKQKYINLVKILSTHDTINLHFVVTTTYDDNMYDYWLTGICDAVDGDIISLICVEYCIQDVMPATVNVIGDTKLCGDLLVTNQETKLNYVSIDPGQHYVGINTDARDISYADGIYSTTTNIYNAKHNVHVQGTSYPVMVSERIQENSDDLLTIDGQDGHPTILTATDDQLNTINPRYFGTSSGFTVKRKSNLYTFDEISKCANELNTQYKLDPNHSNDNVTKMRYGSDISFEVCDSTNRTVELLDIQGTIDEVTSDNVIKGGFGVQVYDLLAGGNKTMESARRNIMYVDNSGTLFINKICLDGVNLENREGDLYWNDKKVLTEPPVSI